MIELDGTRPCRRIRLTNDRYGAHLQPSSAAPGDTVTVGGTTLRGEDGRWVSARRIDLWWNYRWRDGPPGVTGSLMARIPLDTECRFSVELIVPRVPPGLYPYTALVYDAEGYGLFGWGTLRVAD